MAPEYLFHRVRNLAEGCASTSGIYCEGQKVAVVLGTFGKRAESSGTGGVITIRTDTGQDSQLFFANLGVVDVENVDHFDILGDVLVDADDGVLTAIDASLFASGGFFDA